VFKWASLGFLLLLPPDEAQRYWAQVIADIECGARVLAVARQAGRIVGVMQFAPATKRHAAHRAEVQKLLIHTRPPAGHLRRADAGDRSCGDRAGMHVAGARHPQRQYRRGLYRQLGYIRAGEIPRSVRSANGRLDDTVFFYRFVK
jgi:hypothetical protein